MDLPSVMAEMSEPDGRTGAAIRAAAATVAESIFPILETMEGSKRRTQIGSAFMIRYQDEGCLVTAHHVVSGSEKKTIVLAPGRSDTWPTSYKVLRPRQPEFPEADVAFAFAALDGDHGSGVSALTLDQFDASIVVQPNMGFVAIGYPASRATLLGKELRNERFYAQTQPASRDTLDALIRDKRISFDPRVHIAVKYDKKEMHTVSGQIQDGPKPHGMSGGVLFVITGENAPDGPRVVLKGVGILVNYHRPPHDVLVATRIECLLGVILKDAPDPVRIYEAVDA